MNYRKISAKIILLLLILLPFFSAFPANAALLKVTLKSDYIQINSGGTANLTVKVTDNSGGAINNATVAFTATPLTCTPPANTTTNNLGIATRVFTGPAAPPTVVCVIKATATSGTNTGSATATIIVGSDYAPLVPLPGIGSPTSFPAYLVGLYELALMSIAIFAMLMILYGGFKYMTSAGNPALMGDAKDAIWSAIFGLILALLSWLILSTVNPELTMIKTPGTTFSPFTAPATSTTYAQCSYDGSLTKDKCLCIGDNAANWPLQNVPLPPKPCNDFCNQPNTSAIKGHLCLHAKLEQGLNSNNVSKNDLFAKTNSDIYFKATLDDPTNLLVGPYTYTFSFSGPPIGTSGVADKTFNSPLKTFSTHAVFGIQSSPAYYIIKVAITDAANTWIAYGYTTLLIEN